MVLTRLSHFGEVCPLSDHSYSDPASPSTSVAHKRLHPVLVGVKSEFLSLTSAQQRSQSQDGGLQIHIFDLPNEIHDKIFSYLTYKKIGEIRLTCKRFEQIGFNILNTTFQRLQNQMLQRFQTIKGQMPRRESARRTHPLARESDIVETLHMRLTLLQMSFGKHIERKHCCFFAGDILDEVYRLLAYIKRTPNLDRAYIVTDELFDLSTMAMEYFKEHIEPLLPELTCFGSEFLDITSRFSEECSVRSPSGSGRSSEPEDEVPEHEALPQSNMVLRKRIKRIRQGMRRYNTQLAAMKRELKSCKGKLADQHKQVLEYATRMDEYDKKFEESSRKFSTVLQELNKCKTELQYWRSKSPAQPLLCFGCSQSLGDGPIQSYQHRGQDAVVYVPMASASAPECGQQKAQPPPVLMAVREEGRDRCHSVGGPHRSASEPLPQLSHPHLLPSSIPSSHSSTPSSPSSTPSSSSPSSSLLSFSSPSSSSSSCSSSSSSYFVQQPTPPLSPPLFQSISRSHPSSSKTSQGLTSCSLVPTLNSVPAARPLPISQAMLGTSAITTSLTVTAPVVVSAPPSSMISQQSCSAFHSCISSPSSTDLRWYGDQEHAEDLSMSRPNKHYLDDSVDFGCLKRRGSDDESDNCDSVDTVGRRVKERKRIKLDIF